MKTLTKRQRQWLWFVGLWSAGLCATALLAAVTRWLAALERCLKIAAG